MVSDDGRSYYTFPGTLDNESQNRDSYSTNELQNNTTRSPESYESTSEQDSMEENDISRLSAQLTPASSGDSQMANQPHQSFPAKPQPARQRTTQACSKCRERKTKCSGHRPVCLRCSNRGLICEYAQRETRVRAVARTRQYNAVSPPTSTRQPDFASRDMPTPAIHSRMGGNQTNAFASPSRHFGPVPAAASSSRLNMPMHSISRNISTEGSQYPAPPVLHHKPDGWHSPSQRIVGPGPPQQELANRRVVSNSHSFSNDPWVHSSSSSYLPVQGYSSYNERDIMFGQSQFQPPYPPLHIHDRGRTAPQNASGSMVQSSSMEQFDFGLSSLPSFSIYPPVPRPQGFGGPQRAQQSPIPSSISSGEAAYPPYTSRSGSTSSFFDAHAPSPFYANSSNSSRSNVTTSQLEVACPTPSAPIGFDTLGETAQTFQTFDRGYYDMPVMTENHGQDHIPSERDNLSAPYT